MEKMRKLGFTLIELLVVISIIGLISGVILVSFKGSGGKARDAHRVMEIDHLYKQLEICYSEQGGFPDPGSGHWDDETVGYSYSNSCGPCLGNLETAIGDCFPQGVLKDPINESDFAYFYFYFEPTATKYPDDSGVDINDICKGHYALMAHLEFPDYETKPVNSCFNEPAPRYEYWRILGY